MSTKPKLYIFVKQATHFLKWELPEFNKYFEIVNSPSSDAFLLSFGPDAIEEAIELPALKHFATTFPGFGHNPLYSPSTRELHMRVLPRFDKVFINPGPLEIAYKDLNNIGFYPFSIDLNIVKFKKYRTKIDSLLHVSGDAPQKDWERSQEIMNLTGMKNEVFPPREESFHHKIAAKNAFKNRVRRKLGFSEKKYMPAGYIDHSKVVTKYQQYDGFIHVAKDIKNEIYLDGKYTAALMEAGATGSILFWHDTFNLGNGLETVFNLSLDPREAANRILEISKSIDVKKHSELTRQEILDTFNVHKSVGIRAKAMLEQ